MSLDPKVCSKCKTAKSLSSYSKRSDRPIGVQSRCKECFKQYRVDRLALNPLFIDIERERGRQQSAKHKDRVRSYAKAYQQANLEYFRYVTRTRDANKLKATPTWVNKTDLKQVYASCPKEKQVDHIVPLKNPSVCGLHVPWNLQYLTKEENLKKGNKLLWGS